MERERELKVFVRGSPFPLSLLMAPATSNYNNSSREQKESNSFAFGSDIRALVALQIYGIRGDFV